MASQASFDVTTGADLQEVDNAINQARKEIAQRFDFKGTRCTLELDRSKSTLELEADDAMRMKSVLEIVKARLAKRGVPLKNLEISEDRSAGPSRVKRTITIVQGISGDTARAIVKAFKAEKFKKVQIAIQAEQLRVSSASKDSLQSVMSFLKERDFGIELRFENYR